MRECLGFLKDCLCRGERGKPADVSFAVFGLSIWSLLATDFTIDNVCMVSCCKNYAVIKNSQNSKYQSLCPTKSALCLAVFAIPFSILLPPHDHTAIVIIPHINDRFWGWCLFRHDSLCSQWRSKRVNENVLNLKVIALLCLIFFVLYLGWEKFSDFQFYRLICGTLILLMVCTQLDGKFWLLNFQISFALWFAFNIVKSCDGFPDGMGERVPIRQRLLMRELKKRLGFGFKLVETRAVGNTR